MCRAVRRPVDLLLITPVVNLPNCYKKSEDSLVAILLFSFQASFSLKATGLPPPHLELGIISCDEGVSAVLDFDVVVPIPPEIPVITR